MEDPENPREVARYEVPEAGAHNLWIEDDKMYVAYYQAGLRVVDVSGELRGDLYRQGTRDRVVPDRDAGWTCGEFADGVGAAAVQGSRLCLGPELGTVGCEGGAKKKAPVS